jgi:hypothetical protein
MRLNCKRVWKLAAQTAVCAVIACSNNPQIAGVTGTGNPPQTVATISMRAYSQTAAMKSTAEAARTIIIEDGGGSVVTVESLKMYVESITFIAAEQLDCPAQSGIECDNTHFNFTTPLLFNLIDETVQPSIAPFLLPSGKYDEVQFRLGSVPQDSVSYPIAAGYSLELSGTFSTPDNGRHEIHILLKLDRTIELDPDSAAFTVVESCHNRIQTQFDISGWLQRIDIIQCLDNGSVALDSDTTLTIINTFPCGELRDPIQRAMYSGSRITSETVACEPSE